MSSGTPSIPVATFWVHTISSLTSSTWMTAMLTPCYPNRCLIMIWTLHSILAHKGQAMCSTSCSGGPSAPSRPNSSPCSLSSTWPTKWSSRKHSLLTQVTLWPLLSLAISPFLIRAWSLRLLTSNSSTRTHSWMLFHK